MGDYYLAIDIGASSGRHMLGYLRNNQIVLEEIYRFANGMESVDGSLCWNVNNLFEEIKNGLIRCKELGKIPDYMGIDTWGVDYVLLDKEDKIIDKVYGYRDHRTAGMEKKVSEKISFSDLYRRTGIQKQSFNTIYQLMSVRKNCENDMKNAETMLMMPDYFHFLLTGVKKTEYTNATTTQLVNAKTKDWDYELIELLGFRKKLFAGLSMPGTVVGRFTKRVQEEVGFDCQVILPASHDTGSAVLSVPTASDDALYISSGTWSLMGTEQYHADCSEESMRKNFTNEGGYDYRFRYLKNIMGLWMIQSVKKEWKENYSFSQICEMASKETITSFVDCNDTMFLAPDSMVNAVKEYCTNTSQDVPETIGELAAVIYHSLAKCYADTACEIEKMTGKQYKEIYIVGGGANAEFLNQLTAKYTGKLILAGPTEATAIGNLAAQMIQTGKFKDIYEARACIGRSFEIKEYRI